jgi:hypothetical protein
LENTFIKGKTEEEIWSIADPFADRILSAVTTKDIDAFSADFTARIKSLLTRWWSGLSATMVITKSGGAFAL